MLKKLTYLLIGALLTALAAFGLTGCKDGGGIQAVDFGGELREEYVRNEEIDLSDLYVNIVYKGGESKTYPLPYEGVTVTGGDTSVAGENLSLTVSYKGYEKTFNYSVRNPRLTLDFGDGLYEDKTSLEISAESNYTDVSEYLPTPNIWGYEFAGWFYDQEFTAPVKYNFGEDRIETSSDITVYAGYDLAYSDKFVYEENSDGQIVLTGLQTDMYFGFGELYIPETIKLRPVVKIDDGFVDSAFAFMMSYISLKFADNSKVTEIGDEAFSGVISLEEVNLPSGLKRIGNDAFSGVSVTSLVIPASVEILGQSSFSSERNLVNVEFKDNSKLNFIGESAFAYCSGLSSVALPESLVTLSPYAFNYCTNLEEVYIGKNVKQVGLHAFASCSRLMTITISPENASYKTIDGNVYSKDETTFVRYCFGKNEEEFTLRSGVTSIYESAFDATGLNQSLKILNLPDTLTHINDYAFKELDAKLTIPASVTYLSDNALTYYLGTELNVDENNAYYTMKDGVVYSKDLKTLVSIPANAEITEFILDPKTEVIATGAFIGNEKVKYFVVPENSALNTIRSESLFIFRAKSLCGVYFENSIPANVEENALLKKGSIASTSVFLYVKESDKDAYVSKWNSVELDATSKLSDRIVVVSDAYLNALTTIENSIGLAGDVTLEDFTESAEGYVNGLMSFATLDTNVYSFFSNLFISLDSAYKALDYVSADNYVNNKELEYIKVFEKIVMTALTDFYYDADDTQLVRQTSFYLIKEHYDNLPSAISGELTSLENKFGNILSRTDEIILKQREIINTANELVADDAKNFDLEIAERISADYDKYGTLLVSSRWSDFINITSLQCSILMNDFIETPKDPDHYHHLENDLLKDSVNDLNVTILGIESYLSSYFKAPLLRKKLYRYTEFASVYEQYLATDKDRIILETNEAVKNFDLVDFDREAALNVFNNYELLAANEKNYDYLNKFYDIIFRINVSGFISMEIIEDNYYNACDFANAVLSDYRDHHESSLLPEEDDAKIDSQLNLLFVLFEQHNADFVAEIKKIEKDPSVADVYKFYKLYNAACSDLIAPYYPVTLTDEDGEYETNAFNLYYTLMTVQFKKQTIENYPSITTEEEYDDFSNWLNYGYIYTDENKEEYTFKGINIMSYNITLRSLNIFQPKLLTEEELAKYDNLIEQYNNFFGQGDDSGIDYE